MGCVLGYGGQDVICDCVQDLVVGQYGDYNVGVCGSGCGVFGYSDVFNGDICYIKVCYFMVCFCEISCYRVVYIV